MSIPPSVTSSCKHELGGSRDLTLRRPPLETSNEAPHHEQCAAQGSRRLDRAFATLTRSPELHIGSRVAVAASSMHAGCRPR